MRVKGALHVHSKLSRDGTMTIVQLAEWYGRRGYQFLAIGEHAEDLNEAKVQALGQQSAESSSPQFCVIPGIEFACRDDMHLLGIGAVRLAPEQEPRAMVQALHEEGVFVVLAHPRRIRWSCPPDVLCEVDAAEIWNVGYDGKYLPSPQALGAYQRMRQTNPRLLAVASHDFHRVSSFYDVAIEMDVPSLSAREILRNLREGCYRIRSPFFHSDPRARLSWGVVASIRVLGWQLANLRKARAFLLRWSS